MVDSGTTTHAALFGMAHLVKGVRLCSGWMRPHVTAIGMAAVATVLVIYGETINRVVKKRIRSLPWMVRLLIFVALCAVGYAAVAVFLGRLTGRFLAQLDNLWLAPMVVVLFLVVGFVAERKGHV